MTGSALGLARFCRQRKERTARNRTQSVCVEMQGLDEARPIQEVAGGCGGAGTPCMGWESDWR